MGRDGKTHNRNLDFDVKFLCENKNVELIICLLNEYELRTIGVDIQKYQKICL